MIAMCVLTHHFISDYLRETPDEKIIYEYSTQKLISPKEFHDKYYSEVMTQTATGLYDKNGITITKDTLFRQPLSLMSIDAIEIADGRITYFIFTPLKEQASFRFSFSAKTLLEKKIATAHIWFFEDYFRWKSKH